MIMEYIIFLIRCIHFWTRRGERDGGEGETRGPGRSMHTVKGWLVHLVSFVYSQGYANSVTYLELGATGV